MTAPFTITRDQIVNLGPCAPGAAAAIGKLPSGAFTAQEARDGTDCWYCGDPLADDITIEHLIPKSKGGSNSLNNFVLAHGRCNNDAADMPLVDKIALRARLRERVPA